MLIDSHCHLPTDLEKARQLINNAQAEGVVKFINVGTSIGDSRNAISMARNFPEVYATCAVYSHEDRENTVPELRRKLQELLDLSVPAKTGNGVDKKIVAIGECGIDISGWHGGRSIEEQIGLFSMQVELAIENDLPIIIHNREGDEHVLKVLNAYKGPKLRGVDHCFASTWEYAEKMMDLGFLISFSGLITYPSRKSLMETVEKVPLTSFVVETDAPYLPPQGHRGETNEPKYVKMVAQKVAQVKGLPFETIAEHSFENTCRVFKINDLRT